MSEEIKYVPPGEREFKTKPTKVEEVMDVNIYSENLGRVDDPNFAQGPKGVKGPAEVEKDYRDEHAQISALSESLKSDDFDEEKHKESVAKQSDREAEQAIADNLYKNIPWWKKGLFLGKGTPDSPRSRFDIWSEVNSVKKARTEKKWQERKKSKLK